MGAKREFLFWALDTAPWVDYSGISYTPWVHCSASEARGTLKVDISWVERVEPIEVHLLGDSSSRRVVIKASEG